jgi:uncharacterized pyridoxal phosphate-containing UPF0001 family protein
LALVLLSTSLLACKKAKEPTVVQPGESPMVVTSGIRRRIQQNIQDTIRREALLEDMDEIDAMLEDVAKTVLTGLDTLATLDTDRERQTDDFLSTHGAIREARSDALRRYVDLRLQMRELLTEDEWNQISQQIPR